MRKLLRCLFVWRVKYPSLDELKRRVSEAYERNQPIVIVTHDVGLCKENRPGRGNVLLASALEWVSATYPWIPVLAQLGVALPARKFNVRITEIIGPPEVGTRLDRSTEGYNSKTVVDEQKRWCEEQRMFPALALTLANPIHMPRVKWIMEKEGFTVLPVPLPTLRMRRYTDPESLYFSVRVAGRWWWGMVFLYLRELIARLWFLKRGWM